MVGVARVASFLARVISASIAGLIVKYPPAWHVSTEGKAWSSAVGGSAGRFVWILLAKSLEKVRRADV